MSLWCIISSSIQIICFHLIHHISSNSVSCQLRELNRAAALLDPVLVVFTPPSVGVCVWCRDDFNIAVLHAFLELHEFTDLNLVQALRQFLWSFRLPGEAQKIDRMMEAFAQRYCRCNPGVFQSTGTNTIMCSGKRRRCQKCRGNSLHHSFFFKYIKMQNLWHTACISGLILWCRDLKKCSDSITKTHHSQFYLLFFENLTF